MDYYGSPASGSISNTFAYGNMYSSAYAGIVYCYDTKTGNVVWTYGNGGAGNSTQGGLDVPGHYPTFIDAIGNGVVYTTTTEHTIETPLYKGALSRAINATTGAEIWTLNSYVGEFRANSYAMADGYATWFNGLDNQIYSVGKGPSQTNSLSTTNTDRIRRQSRHPRHSHGHFSRHNTKPASSRLPKRCSSCIRRKHERLDGLCIPTEASTNKLHWCTSNHYSSRS